ncbi:MAG: hypothetical protein LUC50_04395 [Ruminococcus sp.]|nr:hypothetical protein [Ruminococcus sp.]
MDGGKCILQLRGVRPFSSDKFDITCHKNYALLSDEHPEHAFDLEKFARDTALRKAILSPETEIEQYVQSTQ